MDSVCATAPTSRAVFVGNVRRVSKRDKAFELQMKLPALISSLSEQVLLEVSSLE